MPMHILISFITIISILVSQNFDYSLEDINPTSSTYGQMIGPSYFAGKSTIHIFSHQN